MLRRPLSTLICILALSLAFTACSKDELATEQAVILTTPELTGAQVALESPIGIDLGRVPLFGIATARFTLQNESRAIARISEARVAQSSGGQFTIVSYPEELPASESAELIIEFVPEREEITETARIELVTNATNIPDGIIEVQLQGTGYFVGEPRLEVSYGGTTYPVEGDCSTAEDGSTQCELGTLNFGNVPLNTTGTQAITLRNNPLPDTCLLPSLPDGSPDCTPVCVITFNEGLGGDGIGLGFRPDNEGFSIVGSAAVPFQLAPSNPACVAQDSVIRGELDLLVSFTAGAEERDAASSLLFESDAPNANLIDIPLQATSREAPVAVAEQTDCNGGLAPDVATPLQRVCFQGTDSYDPRNAADPTLIVGYRWQIIDSPSGADQGLFDLAGETAEVFSFWLPLAGQYTVRLYVTNDVGIESGVSDTSDITFTALPDSRLHVQLVWDTPTTDLDLHMVYAGQSQGEVYHRNYDCYWHACRPDCEEFSAGACDQPTRWFVDHEAFEGPNPHLDIDDTNGLGPENINVDEPVAADFHLYTHYYAIGSGEQSFTTQATIRVYADGVLRAEYRRALEKNDLWAIGKINWGVDGNVNVIPALSDDTNVIGSVQQLNFIPPNGEGFDFGDVF